MHVDRGTLHLTDAETEAFIAASRYGRLGTVNARGEPHVTPLAYVDFNGAIYFLSLRRSRRSRDLQVNRNVSLCIDDGVGDDDPYTRRRGVVLNGTCALADDDEATMAMVRNRFIERQRLAPEEIQRKTHDWYRIDVSRRSSWDFRKIPAGADFKADRARSGSTTAGADAAP